MAGTDDCYRSYPSGYGAGLINLLRCVRLTGFGFSGNGVTRNPMLTVVRPGDSIISRPYLGCSSVGRARGLVHDVAGSSPVISA